MPRITLYEWAKMEERSTGNIVQQRKRVEQLPFRSSKKAKIDFSAPCTVKATKQERDPGTGGAGQALAQGKRQRTQESLGQIRQPLVR
jgi:hypothetical protein